ncbi:YihY/virulence factor BrkB family protein [Histidinibacterium aquaticum]|uniref:YihY/virulence factor BrkB family protein n=1 Tax=Histidinibacterium aquaticum TaxID=2613962 RepID=A0A5J5GJM1_9RHOB|nr:YihY/virulence factor BrkB family protein [Histidinibacterium aquaticum]KAA9007953.1 YihY/virulence factor BrkB family protein [Histidinibacterium aquaticum]
MTLRRLWRIIQDVGAEIERTNLGLISAGCAFFGVVAIFPAMAAIVALFGLIADPSVVTDQLELMREIMPQDAYAIFARQVYSLLATQSDTLGWASVLSLGVALWSARLGVAAIMQGLNEIHGRPSRGGVRHVFVALLLTASLIGVALTALVAVVISPILLAFLPLGPYATVAAEAVRWATALTVLLAGLGILYRFGPNAKGERPPWFTPGAWTAVILWLAASVGFSIYLSNFGNYNRIYGSIGAVIALMMWFYISAYLVLMGAVMNKQFRLRAERKAERRRMEARSSGEPVPPEPEHVSEEGARSAG